MHLCNTKVLFTWISAFNIDHVSYNFFHHTNSSEFMSLQSVRYCQGTSSVICVFYSVEQGARFGGFVPVGSLTPLFCMSYEEAMIGEVPNILVCNYFYWFLLSIIGIGEKTVMINVRQRPYCLGYAAIFVKALIFLTLPLCILAMFLTERSFSKLSKWLCCSYSDASNITRKNFLVEQITLLAHIECLRGKCLRDRSNIFCAFACCIWTPGCNVLITCWKQ